MLKNLAL